MQIRNLVYGIPDLRLEGREDTSIAGITSNSQNVKPGYLFVARKGRSYDGNRFIPQAIAAGAVAILTSSYDPTLEVVQLIHDDIDALEGLLAARYHGYPSQDLFMVGITGTNGKTTTATLIKHILDKAQVPCGLIGTIEYIVGQHRYPASRTTPDVCSNHYLLAKMVQEGCEAAVMEVTSHALDQNRVAHIDFDVAVFTNLTPEHLDYHGTMEKYAEAKQILFQNTNKAIANYDSPWHRTMLQGSTASVMTYGLESGAELCPQNLSLSADGSHFTLTYEGQTVNFHVPLAGRFNVSNALAAIAVGLTNGIPLTAIAKSLATFQRVPGRLEPVANSLGIKIYVDFAHTDDALDNTLKCLQELKVGRIITVFGCGGDRDRNKRPKMAQVSERLSDITIVTSDNPRTEKPEEICREIVSGFSPSAKYVVEVDRRKAIQKAIEMAHAGDIILIAGKGHETYQIFADQTVPFSDSDIAREICDALAKQEVS